MKPNDIIKLNALNEDIKHALDNANLAEYEVTKQVIIVDSGALAIIGGFVINKNYSNNFSQQALLTLVVSFLIISLVTALIQFSITRHFFKKLQSQLAAVAKTITGSNPPSNISSYVDTELHKVNTEGSVVFYWISTGAFMIGAVIVSVVVITNIW